MDSQSHTRPGRPRLPDNQRRTKTLRVRLSPGETGTLWRAARRLGMSDSKFVREVVLREAERVLSVAEFIEQENEETERQKQQWS